MTGPIESINAVTLVVSDMRQSVGFYESIGFELGDGGADSTFATFRLGAQALNLTSAVSSPPGFWGRVIFHVRDVDEMHLRVREAGHEPEAGPRDAPWGERYFHIHDPDGHQLSFARRLDAGSGSLQ